MEHTKHLWRAILILIAVLVAGTVTRHFMIPASFGQAGPYRYDALQDLRAKAPVHGSQTACQSCHTDVWETNLSGKHASVSCEVCHAPVTFHADGEQKIADMPSNREANLCADCHETLAAKPDDMPQVNLMEHLISLEAAPEDGIIQEGTCLVCHDVHNPSLKEEITPPGEG